jgi:leucyl-tRNA synthetase
VCEELWQHVLGGTGTVCDAPWPAHDEEYLAEDTVSYTVSFNGKARFNIELPVGTAKDDIQQAATTDERAEKWMEGKTIVKVIVVPGKLINIVLK